MPLTNSVPLLTSQPLISWLKDLAKRNILVCGSRGSRAILILVITSIVAMILEEKQMNGVRLFRSNMTMSMNMIKNT